jgi:hypothetical protein
VKLVLAWTLYYLGDFVSKLMNTELTGWLYPVYNKLMIWSSELDVNGRIWKKCE